MNLDHQGCGIQRWLDSDILVGVSESAELFKKCLKETDFKLSSQYCDSEKETFSLCFRLYFYAHWRLFASLAAL